MAIFIKQVVESAQCLFKINADTKEDADKALNYFLAGEDDRYDDYREMMNCGLHDQIVDLARFDNEDAYNRLGKGFLPEFEIDAEKELKEPRYDLYFLFKDKNFKDDPFEDYHRRKTYFGIKMSEVIWRIQELNKDYILHPNPGVDVDCYKEASKNNATVIAYRLERRKTND